MTCVNRRALLYLNSVQLVFMLGRARYLASTQGVLMNRFFSARTLAASAVVLGAFGAATAAQAHSDVAFSVGVNVPGAYVQPAPVHVQPQPAYVQAQPAYVTPRPVEPRHLRGWERHGPYGDRDRDGIPNAYDRHDDRHAGRYAQARGPWGDYDRDGVPNRYDRFPANPYRR
jgi:hypothetical protein